MRLFIAVNPPDSVRSGVWKATQPMRDAGYPVRWVDRSSVHLTLKFLGNVERTSCSEITRAIEAAADGVKQFVLGVAGFGAFPTLRRPRVIWVGCHALPPLELVQHGLEVKLADLGFRLEAKPFRPHMTIGRAKREVHHSMFRDFAATLERLDYSGEMSVESIDLMESQLSSKGAQYTILDSVSLPE